MTQTANLRNSAYTENIIAFVDILGYSEQILGADEQVKNDLIAIQRNWSNLQGAGFYQCNKEQETATYCPNVTSLSDTIVFTLPTKADGINNYAPLRSVLLAVAELHLHSLAHGLLLRGAVVIGKVEQPENNIYGEGLAIAAKQEQSEYRPIVMIDEAVINSHPLHDTEKSWYIGNDGGTSFVDFFAYFKAGISGAGKQSNYEHLHSKLNEFKTEIENGLRRVKEAEGSPAAKWRWMVEYFNRALYDFQNDNRFCQYVTDITPIITH